MKKTVKDLLAGNITWAQETLQNSPDFFNNLALGQEPPFLWIGCSDSRVPETEITGSTPGTIFVQRNIANMVVHTDFNLLSVVNYAVKHLKVKHIIVCGHYGCGGIQAAMSNKSFGFLDDWLMHIKDVYRSNQQELEEMNDEKSKFDRFVELNVQEQVNNLSKVSFIQEEWDKGEFPIIHGIVYNLKDGLLKDLNISVNNSKHLEGIYKYNN